MTPALQALQERLGYRFGSASLLRQALTHRSHGSTHNERLEFLGDSVLNCAVASLLYQTFGKLDEGDLSRVRANLVKQQALFEIAQRLELSTCLLLGEGEQKSGGFRRPSILADTLEAVFGAIFLDGGFDAAQQAIHRLYEPVLRNVDPNTLGKDAKTLLQEWLQSRKIPLPVYAVVATHGAAHNQLFEVECAVPKLSIQVLGSGGSRRAAEQAAAKLALEQAQAIMPATVRKPRRNARSASQPTAADSARPAPGGDRPSAVEPIANASTVEGATSGVPATASGSELDMQGASAAVDPGAISSGPIATDPTEVRVAPLPARGRTNAAMAGVTAGVGTGPANPLVPETPDSSAVPVPAVDPPRRRAHAA